MERALFMHGLWDHETNGRALAGIEALVERYYSNYTDATELEPSFVALLVRVCREADVDEEGVERAVRRAEARVDRPVRTASVYEDEEEG